MDRHDRSTSGIDGVPARAKMRIDAHVRVVSFDRGRAYEGRRPGELVAVCGR